MIPILPASTSSCTYTATSTTKPQSTPITPPFSRLTSLPAAQLSDLFLTAQRVARMLTRVYGARGINWAVQDGLAAGQSVAHVHVHLIPRGGADERAVAATRGIDAGEEGLGDAIYEDLENWDGRGRGDGDEVGGESRARFPAFDQLERRDRSVEEMEIEARWLRGEMLIQERLESGGENEQGKGS